MGQEGEWGLPRVRLFQVDDRSLQALTASACFCTTQLNHEDERTEYMPTTAEEALACILALIVHSDHEQPSLSSKKTGSEKLSHLPKISQNRNQDSYTSGPHDIGGFFFFLLFMFFYFVGLFLGDFYANPNAFRNMSIMVTSPHNSKGSHQFSNISEGRGVLSSVC